MPEKQGLNIKLLMKTKKRDVDIFSFVPCLQKTPMLKSWHELLLTLSVQQNSQSHSQTTLNQVLPVTLLVLPRCLRPAQPENMSPICVIMSPFL